MALFFEFSHNFLIFLKPGFHIGDGNGDQIFFILKVHVRFSFDLPKIFESFRDDLTRGAFRRRAKFILQAFDGRTFRRKQCRKLRDLGAAP